MTSRNTAGPAILNNVTELFARELPGSLKALFIPLLDLIEHVLTERIEHTHSQTARRWHPAHQQSAARLLTTLICLPSHHADYFATVLHQAVSTVTKSLADVCFTGLMLVQDSPALHGARFQTELYTRGCHWIPRMFA